MKITVTSLDHTTADYAVRIITAATKKGGGKVRSITAERSHHRHTRTIDLAVNLATIREFERTNLPLGGMIAIAP